MNGSAYLVRTYFTDVEYMLPTPVMQPIWESVKTAEGTIDYGLSYHRAFYHVGYDNYHDIYLQVSHVVEEKGYSIFASVSR